MIHSPSQTSGFVAGCNVPPFYCPSSVQTTSTMPTSRYTNASNSSSGQTSFLIDDILGNVPLGCQDSGPVLAKPMAVHPAMFRTDALTTTTPTLYKPVAMYEPATLSPTYLAPQLYNPSLVSQLYSVPYPRPEYTLMDRHNAFTKGESQIKETVDISTISLFIIIWGVDYVRKFCCTFLAQRIRRRTPLETNYFRGKTVIFAIYTCAHTVYSSIHKHRHCYY